MLDCFGGSHAGVFDEIDEKTIRWEVGAREFEDPGRDSGREQQILSFGRGVFVDKFENFLDVLLKALFQHLICLIKARYLQVRQLDCSSVQQIKQSPWSAHNDVATLSDLSHLVMHVCTSIHSYHWKIILIFQF